MKKICTLLILVGIFLFASGFSQENNQVDQKGNSENKEDYTPLKKCLIGGFDNQGREIVQNGRADYYMELLPGKSYTGSWYYYVSGTSGTSSTANLIESPEVSWLQVSPAQFTDYVDGIATKVDYIFTTPLTTGTYTTTVVDLNGNWANKLVTLVVTETPTQNLYVFDEQISTNETFETSFWDYSPAYFYWSADNQYYYFNQMAVNYQEYPEKIWFNVLPSSFNLAPSDSTFVTFSANISTPGADSILVFNSMQYYSFPFFYKYNFDVISNSYLNVTPLSRNVPCSSSTTTFNLTSNTTWFASDNASWLTVSPTTGGNSGTLTATCSANTTGAMRVATITITGAGVPVVTLTVTQCPTVTPTNQNVNCAAGTTSFAVNANSTWTVSESVSWLSVSPAIGTNNGTLTVSYDANTGVAARTGTISVTFPDLPAVTVTVTQAPCCSLAVTPANQNVTCAAGTTTFSITTACAWTLSESTSWLSVSPTSGFNCSNSSRGNTLWGNSYAGSLLYFSRHTC